MEREGAPVDPIGGSANATRSEIALPDGAVIELERTEFTARQDTVEAKVQDGARYQGLLSEMSIGFVRHRLLSSRRKRPEKRRFVLARVKIWRRYQRRHHHLKSRGFFFTSSQRRVSC